jgi:hypothetical protein
MIHFVSFVDFTFVPTKLNKNCIISPSIFRIRRSSDIQLCKLVLRQNRKCSFIGRFSINLISSLSKNDSKDFVGGKLPFAREIFDASHM